MTDTLEKNIKSQLVFYVSLLQLKGSDLELTIIKGSSAPRAPLNGPACNYVNLRVKVNNKEQGSAWKKKQTVKLSLAVALGLFCKLKLCLNVEITGYVPHPLTNICNPV